MMPFSTYTLHSILYEEIPEHNASRSLRFLKEKEKKGRVGGDKNAKLVLGTQQPSRRQRRKKGRRVAGGETAFVEF